MTSASKTPIDIVIAWVDGSDPQLKQKRQQFLNPAQSAQAPVQASDAISSTRFASNHEIYYNLASIIKYVPFVNRIFIVADNQQPALLDELKLQIPAFAQKIKMVDHRELFHGYEQYLPTFNTRSIEAMLWNIPDISRYFIYLNDDFFFNAPVQIEDFLLNDQIVIYGHWENNWPIKAKLNYRQFLQRQFGKPVQPKHLIAQMMSADMLGLKQFFEVHHYPKIMDRDILRDYLLAHPATLAQQLSFKFRDVAQFNPVTLMNHLKIQHHQAILKPDLKLAYLKNAAGLTEFITNLQNLKLQYGCVQSLDQMQPHEQQQIAQAFASKFSHLLPFSLQASTTIPSQSANELRQS